MYKAIALFLAGIFISSCETETFVSYEIDNLSTNDIIIQGSNIIYSTEINQTIKSKEISEIASWSKLGKQTNYFEPTSMFGNDLVITNAMGDNTIIDNRLLSNWNSSREIKRSVAIHRYVLEIDDSDF